MIGSRIGLVASAVAVSATMLAAEVRAQDFPTRPIALIVPFPAGGSTDLTLRAMAEVAERKVVDSLGLGKKAIDD